MILSASLSIIFTILLSHQPSSATPINTTIVNDDCENNDKIVSVYDERQNGSENVRVNVKDVLFVWAPEDKINSEFLDYPANEEVPQNPVGSNEIQKPTSIIDILNSFQESSVTYSSTQKPNVNNNSLSVNNVSNITGTSLKMKRSKYRLSGLILPLFKSRLGNE